MSKTFKNTLFVKCPNCECKFWIQTEAEYFINMNGMEKIVFYWDEIVKPEVKP